MMSDNLEQRIKELEKLSYQKISAIASPLGITKTEGQKWRSREILEAIAKKEMEITKDNQVKETHSLIEKVSSDSVNTVKPNYKKGLIIYCGVCDRPLKTNTAGIATCH